MALALKDRVKETTIVVGTGSATLLGSSIGFQPFSVVGNGNTTYYCISDQFGSNWEVGIGTYSSSGNTLARTTVLASSNGGALVVFTAGVKDVFVTYPAEKGVWLDASNNAIGLGTPAAFVGTNITGTASGLTAGNVTTNANLTGAVTSSGNATSLGSFTSLQLATALTDETGSGSAVFATSPTLANPTYTGTLTGSTGILNIGSGQIYKDASGNVGIGALPNGSFKAEITGGTNQLKLEGTQAAITLKKTGVNGSTIYSDATNNLIFYRDAVGESMRIDSSGNVGIGTSSPSYRLEVKGASATAGQLSIHDGTGDTTVSGATAGSLLFQARDSSIRTIAEIDAVNTTTNGTGGAMVFQTRISDALAERMRINSSGNVGIGTSSPSGKTHIYTTVAVAAVNQASSALNIENTPGDPMMILTGAFGGIIASMTSAQAATPMRFFTGTAERMRIDSSGNLLVGTTSALFASSHDFVNSGSAVLGLRNSAATAGLYWQVGPDSNSSFKVYNASSVGVFLSNGATAWASSSDERLKTDLVPIENGLDKVNSLRSVTGRFKTDEEGVSRSFLIAQDVQKVLPEAVSTSADGTLALAYTEVIPLLVASIKELKAIIDTQQEQINSLLGK